MKLNEKVRSIYNVIIGHTDTINTNQKNIYLKGLSGGYDASKPETISTVYTCISILSETLAKLPAEVYQFNANKGKLKDKDHYLYNLIHYNPNPYTTSHTFFSTLETQRNLKGNSFAKIHREAGTGRVSWLEIIPPSRIKGYKIVRNNLYYIIVKKDGETEAVVNAGDMLHFRMITKDGVWGINPIEALRLNLSTYWEGLSVIKNFYENNAFSPKALKSTVSGANQKAMLEALEKFKDSYAGASAAGSIMPLPPNTELQDIALNLADQEFINTIKYNTQQIASLYGIPAHLVGLYEASKYSNVEQMSLDFKVNKISSVARMYRQELEFKLLTELERRNGKSVEFNLMAMVETDHNTRLSGYKTLSSVGAITPNKIAALEGLETYEGGDKHYMQKQMTPVELLGNDNVKTE